MKAFLVGFLFLIAVAILCGIGFLLLPLIAVLGFFLKFAIAAVLMVLAIWLLGKSIIFVWETIKEK